jgi:hypothetical protein
MSIKITGNCSTKYERTHYYTVLVIFKYETVLGKDFYVMRIGRKKWIQLITISPTERWEAHWSISVMGGNFHGIIRAVLLTP